MKTKVASLLAICVLCAAPALVNAGTVTVTVLPSVAPNAFGSPSWAGYVSNAMTGLQTNQTTVGDRTVTPTGYTGGVTSVTAGQIEVTSFNSWEGNANPTGAFQNELGNRLHFGLTVVSTSQQFDLADVGFSITSNDVGDDLGYTGDLSGTDFSTGTRIGLSYGADGIKGTADDILYDAANPGSDTSMINELYYVGVGNAEWPGGSDPDPSNPLLGQQGAIDAETQWIDSNISDITGSYTINFGTSTATGSADVAVTAVPLPSAAGMGLGMLGVFGLGGLIRRKLRTA